LALCNLCFKHADNQAKAGGAGAIEAVVAALRPAPMRLCSNSVAQHLAGFARHMRATALMRALLVPLWR
jgi:hypothetical protein